ncbi:MAG: hypothetical protein KGI35_11250, partial [Burkholderiales bacterium]|nr:hypothetical protein [Burkholderiales bacterium]
MATLRIKSTWFKPGADKTPEQNASAMAFIAWRVAVKALQNLRAAGFSIDAGPPYFGVVRELLVFLLAATDRLAYARLGVEARAAFTPALVRRVAEILAENESELIDAPTGQDFAGLFIEQFNRVGAQYGEFDWSESEGPDFAFMRYLGSRLEALLPAEDRRWIVEQVMAAEAPAAAVMLARAMQGLWSTEPWRTRRAALSG